MNGLSRRVQAVAGGVLAQLALLLAALLPISHESPPSMLALVSGLTIGFVGGIAAGHLSGDRTGLDLHVALPVGAIGGGAFATTLAYLILTDTASGVFWHFHYLLASTAPPELVVDYGTVIVVGFAVACGLAVAAFAVAGNWFATDPRIGRPD